MEDCSEGLRSVEWSGLCAGEQLGFLHVMGIWLDLIFFYLALVPSLFLLSPEGGLWRSLAPWEAGGGCWIRLLQRRWERSPSWCLRVEPRVAGAQCMGSQVLLTTHLPDAQSWCRQGACCRRSLAQGLEVQFEEASKTRSTAPTPAGSPGGCWELSRFLLPSWPGTGTVVEFSCFLFSDLSPSRGPQK